MSRTRTADTVGGILSLESRAEAQARCDVRGQPHMDGTGTESHGGGRNGTEGLRQTRHEGSALRGDEKGPITR